MLKKGIKLSQLLWCIWLFMFILFYLEPIEYIKDIDFTVWFVIFMGVTLFTLGEMCATLVFPVSNKHDVISQSRLNNTVLWCSLLGIVGILLLSYDKLALSGLDYSKGLAYIREERGRQLAASIDIGRSVWLYLGYPLFSFSYPAIMLLVLCSREITPLTGVLAQISVISPIGYALLYGGRMSIFLLLVLVFCCCIIRKSHGKSFIPKEHGILLKTVLLSTCLLVYSNYVLLERRGASHQVDYNRFVIDANANWGLEPKQWIEDLRIDDVVSDETVMNAITNSMYLSNGVVSLSKIIDNQHTFAPVLGTFQVGILSPLLRVFYSDNVILMDMESSLKNAAIYGFFATAWGAIFLDFGVLGAALFIVFWGFIGGITFYLAKNPQAIGTHLILAFGYTSIFMSVFNGPFGMANSFLIFVSLLFVAILLNSGNRVILTRETRLCLS